MKSNKKSYFLSQEKAREECGIFGIFSKKKKVSPIIYEGLYALQHRGQEGAGISVYHSKEKIYSSYKNHGLVQNVFNDTILNRLNGNFGIGHVRYSTHGDSRIENVQPLFLEKSKWGKLALVHNGNIMNAKNLKEELSKNKNIQFKSTSDSEIFLQNLKKYESKAHKLEDAFLKSLENIKGAYSLLLMSEKEIIAIRDPYGFRPLSIGILDDDTYCFASETCAFDQIGAKSIKSLAINEYCIINKDGIFIKKINQRPLKNYNFCIFEFIYLARPDSIIDHKNVYQIRKKIGRSLAKEHPIDADIVVPIPDSGIPAALGYSEASNIPFEMGILRSHYSSRSFIQNNNIARKKINSFKLKPIQSVLENKKVILIDDSIIRGNVSKDIIKSVYNIGKAKAVYLLISSPPFLNPCYYGIDTPDSKNLIASIHKSNIEKIRMDIGADFLAYLSLDNLLNCFASEEKNQFCNACFTGNYPIL